MVSEYRSQSGSSSIPHHKWDPTTAKRRKLQQCFTKVYKLVAEKVINLCNYRTFAGLVILWLLLYWPFPL